MAIGGSFNLNSTGNSTSGYNTSIYMNITTFSVGSVSNSRIGIQFSVTNSTGKYNYEGYGDSEPLPRFPWNTYAPDAFITTKDAYIAELLTDFKVKFVMSIETVVL